MMNFTSVAIPGNLEGMHNVSVCQANLCCHLEFELAELLTDTFNYRLLVLDGIMSHDGGFYQSRTQVSWMSKQTEFEKIESHWRRLHLLAFCKVCYGNYIISVTKLKFCIRHALMDIFQVTSYINISIFGISWRKTTFKKW